MLTVVALGMLLAPKSTFVLEDRTELRGRVVAPGDGAVDAETRPVLRYTLVARHGEDRLVFAYAPRLVLTRPDPATVRGEVLHNGVFRADVSRRRFRFVAQEFATYGTASAGTLLVQPRWVVGEMPPLPQPFPLDPKASFTFVSSQSELAASWAFSPRIALTLSAGYFAYGGPDEASRAQLAFSSGPSAEARLDASLSRRDDAGAIVGARHSWLRFATTEGPSTTQGYGEVRGRHRLSRLSQIEAGAGATAQNLEGAGTTVYPSGDVTVTVGFEQRGAKALLVALGRLGPWLNIFTGTVHQRFEASAAASWSFGRNVLFAQASAQVSPADGTGASYRLYFGQLGFQRNVSRTVSIDLGVRAGSQRVTGPGIDAPSTQTSAYAGVTFASLPWRIL